MTLTKNDNINKNKLKQNKQNKTKQNKTKQNKTKQNKTIDEENEKQKVDKAKIGPLRAKSIKNSPITTELHVSDSLSPAILPPKKRVFLLCLDGGGIKGKFSSSFLRELEKDLGFVSERRKKKTKKKKQKKKKKIEKEFTLAKC